MLRFHALHYILSLRSLARVFEAGWASSGGMAPKLPRRRLGQQPGRVPSRSFLDSPPNLAAHAATMAGGSADYDDLGGGEAARLNTHLPTTPSARTCVGRVFQQGSRRRAEASLCERALCTRPITAPG